MRYKNIALATTLIVALGLQGCGGGGTDKSSGKEESTSTAYTAPSEVSKTETDKPSEKMDVGPSKTIEVSVTKPTMYILKKKTISYADHNETTVYNLNVNRPSYISYSTMTSTTGDVLKKKYDYNTTSNTLNVYVKNIIDKWELTQVAKFEKEEVKDVVDFTHGQNRYMINTFDPISFAGYRVVKNIKDIEMGLFNVQTYEYKDDGSIKSIKVGYLDELDGNMTVESENVLETNVLKPAVMPKYSDENMTITDGNRRYEFVEFKYVTTSNEE